MSICKYNEYYKVKMLAYDATKNKTNSNGRFYNLKVNSSKHFSYQLKSIVISMNIDCE